MSDASKNYLNNIKNYESVKILFCSISEWEKLETSKFWLENRSNNGIELEV